MSSVVYPPWPFPKDPIPLLENGDRLTRREFERRYQAMPQVKKAELIEGIVYMPSPVHVCHGQPYADLVTRLLPDRPAFRKSRLKCFGSARKPQT